MPVEWNLKKWLVMERDIYRPSQLQQLLAEKAGVQLSIQAISALINNKPSALRLQTIQALCNALECDLSEFFNVTPDAISEKKKARKAAGDAPVRLYAGKMRTPSDDSIFPDPHTYAKPAGPGQPEDERNV